MFVIMRRLRTSWPFRTTSSCRTLAAALGYLYIRRERQNEILPLGAGWRAGAEPFQSFFGPQMNLSETASRFDASVS